jgi:hypothetical protein
VKGFKCFPYDLSPLSKGSLIKTLILIILKNYYIIYIEKEKAYNWYSLLVEGAKYIPSS